MRRTSALALAPALVLLVACQDQSSMPPPGPSFLIADAAHDGVNPDFFFLPPMVPDPSDNSSGNFDAGEFNPALAPVVEICELIEVLEPDITPDTPCAATQPTGFPVVFTTTSGPGSETVRVSLTDEHYVANWHTNEFALSDQRFYRIFVRVGATQLGFADVDVVNSGKDLKNVDTGEFIALLDGRTLPIKFRIENAALCDPPGSQPCASQTVNLPDGGFVTFDDQDVVVATVDIPQQPPESQQTTITIQECDGIDVDIPTFGPCLTITADPPLEAPLAVPGVISVCILNAGTLGLTLEQEPLLTLHRQSANVTEALPHAEEICSTTVGRADQPAVVRFAQAIGDRLAGLFGVRPLFARRTALVFDVGGGGQFQEFSDFQFALPAQMDAIEGSDGQTAAPGATVPVNPGVRVTDRDGGAVVGATVHVDVTAGNGTVDAMEGLTDANGEFRVVWTLGDEGTNTLRFFGFGIAGPDDGGPFMPDISLPTADQQKVPLATGEVFINATAVTPAAPLLACETTGDTGGDQLFRGFYIPEYPGTTLDRVDLFFSADDAGDFTISLTARDGAFDGPVIGSATAAVTLPADRNTFTRGTFDFSGAAVTPGNTVTFALAQVSGPSTTVFYEVPSLGNEDCPVVQTDDTAPPLSTFRRQGVEIAVFGASGAPQLDQQNLLDGSIGGQGIGRFSDIDGSPDPEGTSFDFQDAQTFTVGISGRLAKIRVPLINLSGATLGVTMEIVRVVGGVPDESQSLGEVTIPASAIPTDFDTRLTPDAWPNFDLTGLQIDVTAGQVLAYIVRSLSTSAYLYNPESSSGYANGVGYRRNRALTATWSTVGQDFGFQTFVFPDSE